MGHFDDNIWTRHNAAREAALAATTAPTATVSLADARESLMNPGGIPEPQPSLVAQIKQDHADGTDVGTIGWLIGMTVIVAGGLSVMFLMMRGGL